MNTAARIQSAAPPGCCYVDETTRAATSAAIAYVDAGEHELKGKAEPVRLFQATRVVAAVAGSQRSGVLEAPFIGQRPRASSRQGALPRLGRAPLGPHWCSSRASPASASRASPGSSSSTSTAWPETCSGTPGAASPTARGSSYWALSEMVRARLQISEEDPLEVVAERLRTGLERWIADPADREFIAPRLGQLLGLPTPQVLAREELFSGWRLFFERLAEHLPVVMVIEDLQWADAGMVDFLDHLLEWSGDHAIFLLVLSRPEGTDRKGLVLSRRSGHGAPARPALRTRSSASSSTASSRACPPPPGRASSSGPRGSRSTRSRRCADCSTRASSRRATTVRSTSSASSASSRSRPG